MSVPRPSPQSPLKPTLRPDVAVRFGKPLVFLLCLTPLALLVWRALSDGLGANPVEAIVHFTGSWALRLLLVTLAVTPLRCLSGQPWLIRFRRMLGLFAFFYALLHFAAYLILDRALVWEDIITDLTKRPYILVGFTALLLLVPLAVTSTRGWIKRLGRHWVTLHRIVYVIAILAVLHFLWLVKADTLEPLINAAVLAVLLAFRVPWGRLVGRRGP
ncbi:MAG: protein-methionine-sulfoxide reductase heme-binding subunit MsrQ [Chromatiaceae bacterium]